MQIDFHHAVTYVLSRLAGFSHEDAVIVAYSAQYVDDAQNKGTIEFDNGQKYDHIASSHSVFDVGNNLSLPDDFQVWVPFHFLPGNNGAAAGSANEIAVDQRLLCQPDSYIASELCRAAMGTNLYRLGITTHVYAVTWAHQRFSGVTDRINEAQDKALEGTIEHIEAFAADVAGLGHGAVSVHPDQPFRVWSYIDSTGKEVSRPNPDIFIQACDRIFDFHLAFLGHGGTRQMSSEDRGVIFEALRSFTSTDCYARHQQWIDLMKAGKLSFGALTDAQAEDLQYQPKGVGSWKYEALGTEAVKDKAGEKFPYRDSFETSRWKQFHDALKAHQAEVLQNILPKFGLPTSAEDLVEHRVRAAAKEMGKN